MKKARVYTCFATGETTTDPNQVMVIVKAPKDVEGGYELLRQRVSARFYFRVLKPAGFRGIKLSGILRRREEAARVTVRDLLASKGQLPESVKRPESEARPPSPTAAK